MPSCPHYRQQQPGQWGSAGNEVAGFGGDGIAHASGRFHHHQALQAGPLLRRVHVSAVVRASVGPAAVRCPT